MKDEKLINLNEEDVLETLMHRGYPKTLIFKINAMLGSFNLAQDVNNDVEIEYCPKCGAYHPRVIKAGMTRKGDKGKQMYRCTECGARFTGTNGGLMHYSHQDVEVWRTLVVDTMTGESIYATAESLNLSTSTVFFMRHKFLSYLEKDEETRIVSGQVEVDETFFNTSSKRTIVEEGYDPKHDTKRGLSNQKTCMVTALDANGMAVAKATGVGNASDKEILAVCDCIENGSTVFSDGKKSYKKLDGVRGMRHVEKDYRGLTRVNSFHSMIKERNRKYRGVSTKYLNRYCALFAAMWQVRGGNNEKFIQTMNMVKGKKLYLTQWQLRHENLFIPEGAEFRKSKVG